VDSNENLLLHSTWTNQVKKIKYYIPESRVNIIKGRIKDTWGKCHMGVRFKCTNQGSMGV
jgi:hypothetical protein